VGPGGEGALLCGDCTGAARLALLCDCATHKLCWLPGNQVMKPAAVWLAGLYIDEAGLLIDEKSGKAVNEFGATRFDVTVRGSRHTLVAANPILEAQLSLLVQSSMAKLPCKAATCLQPYEASLTRRQALKTPKGRRACCWTPS